MKTAYLLFGLASACASAPTEAQYPLCDRDGAPACGNIGQAGRTAKPPATLARVTRGTAQLARPIVEPAPTSTSAASATALAAAHASATGSAIGFAGTVMDTSRRMVPVLTRVLVGASSEIQRVSPLHRPLVDHREQVACGNVMTKGGRTRQCHDADGRLVREVDIDENGDPTGNVFTHSH